MNSIRPTLQRMAAPWALVLAISAGLSGCAGYRAFQQGQSDLSEGRVVEGLVQLRKASELEPGNAEYRRTYHVQRDLLISQLARQADLDMDAGNFDRARSTYTDIQRLIPDDSRGDAGLNRVEVARRHWKALEAATALADKGDMDAALSKVQLVLSENPNHRRAALLQKKLLRQQADVTGKELGLYPKLKAAYRTPVSLTFTNASLRQVFEALKLASGLNYMFDKDVAADARVTLSVTNKAVEDVLRLVMATNQLQHRVLDGDTLLVYPNTAAKAADYREMVVRAFYLSNAEVNKTASLIKSIAKAKDIHVDERLNLIIVRDSAEVVRVAEKLVAAADMVEPEVMLELEVMEVSASRLQNLGIQWPSYIGATVKGAGGTAGQLTLDELQERSKSLVQINVSTPFLAAQLRSEKGNATLLANPRVRVRNRQSAKIMIGDKVPVITVTNTANVGTAESVSYLDVGLKLDIEPTISLDDEVSMKLNLEVSSILDTITRATGTQTYRLGTRNTSTTLRVRDGETNVLAGLIQKEDRQSNTGVPGLNELPLLSRLFGSGQNSDSRTEIVLLITPHVVRSLELPGVGLQEFLSGTENAIGSSPIQLNTPAAPPAPKPAWVPSAPAPEPVPAAPAEPPAQQAPAVPPPFPAPEPPTAASTVAPPGPVAPSTPPPTPAPTQATTPAPGTARTPTAPPANGSGRLNGIPPPPPTLLR